MRRIGLTVALCLLAASGCSKDENKTPANKSTGPDPKTSKTDPGAKTDPGSKSEPAKAGDLAQATTEVGVEAGGIERDADEGPAAVITGAEGTVEVRRVGETEFAAAKANTKLYPGDVVRTADGSTATITLADESVMEVAEVSTVGIGSREGSADPASSAAVLSGLARFTVSARAPGEGAFRVYTPSGIVLTKGTTYGIGVAADGEARVGVESGEVDVVGLIAVDADPITIESGHVAVLEASGEVAAPVEWKTDDWGTWRDEADAEVKLTAAIDGHATMMGTLSAELVNAYADLEATATAVNEFEVKAATSAETGAVAEYEAVLPDGAATIEASFGVAGNIEAMTWAYAGHAELAAGIYERHPEEVKVQWEAAAPRVEAAVLWPKRFEITAAAYLEPLRVQYYVHHPRGRAHADLVGVVVPEFYAKVEPPEIEPVRVRTHVRTRIWIAPWVVVKAQARPVWIAAPQANWHAKVKVRAAPPRAKVAWYIRPPTMRSTIFFGAKVKSKYAYKVKVRAPEPRAKVRAHWKVAVPSVRIKVGPPNLDYAAKARMKVKLDGRGRIVVRDHRAGAVKAGGDASADVKGKVDVRVPDVKGKVDVKVPDVKVRDHRDGAVKAGGEVKGKADGAVKAGADVKVKVKAPKVKVKAPSVKVKGEAKGGFKIGN